MASDAPLEHRPGRPMNVELDRLVYAPVTGRLALLPAVKLGRRRFARSGTTPRWAYVAMRKLYGNDDPNLFERLLPGPRPHPAGGADAPGVASGMVDETLARLRTDGFAVLSKPLDEERCRDLEQMARQATCDLIGGGSTGREGRFDERSPVAIRYDLREADILESRTAQELVADRSLYELAERYLGAPPVQDLVAMWWSAFVGEGASAAAAQQFHFDLDRLSFLKVFVFLTDVDETTGPHEYVRGSHRWTAPELRRDRRHTDAEVARWQPDGEVVSITGRRGTIFLADTRGLHKGRHLERGHRLVFQTEYATSLFGAPYTRVVVHEPVAELVEMAERHPSAFVRFDLRA